MQTKLLLLLPLLLAGLVSAGSLESYRAEWAALRPKLDADIERYRKGDATIELVDANGNAVTNAVLEIRQKKHAFLFGCNILPLGQLGELNEPYEKAFVKLFNLATTTFCWSSIEPEPGRLRFEEGSEEIWRRPPPDRVVAFGKKHGLALKGQPLGLVWYPSWAPKEPEQAKQAYQAWFAKMAGRYGHEFMIVDVVNEALSHPNSKHCLYSSDMAFVAWMFQQAKRYFPPETLLAINDGTNMNGWNRDRYFQLVKRLVEHDAGVSAVGFQFHLFGLLSHFQGKLLPASQLLETYDQFGQLGLPLFITEITIPSTVRPGADGEALQAEAVVNLYQLWFSVPKMAGIIYWNLPDGTAHGNEGRVLAGLLDAQMREKPAYQALCQLIHRKWNTQVQAISDAQGKASFRGFYGTYDIVVTIGDKTQTFEVRLAKDTSIIQLKLK